MIKDDTSSISGDRATRFRPTPLRVAIVGAGFMGRVHATAARSAGARVAAVVSSGRGGSDAALHATGAERAYTDLESALATGIDVVHVCVPNALHASVATAAVRAGAHVVCEKPLTTTVDDADQLLRDASSHGRIGTVPFVYRFHPMVREMRARIAQGRAGRIALVSGSYLQDWLADATDTNWRVDPARGGASRTFADIGSHWFDLMEFVLGDRVERLSAQFDTLFAEREAGGAVRTEDTVTVQFRTAAGVIGSFAASQVARGRRNRLALEVSGDHASFAFDQEQPESMWQGDADGSRTIVRDPGRLSSEAARLSFLPGGHPQGYQDCFNAFVADTYAAVRGDDVEGLPRFADGARAVRLVDAAVRSARDDGAWVRTPAHEDALV